VSVYAQLDAVMIGPADIPEIMSESHRTYPCPECGTPDKVALQRLGVAKATGEIDNRSPVPLEYIRRSLASKLGQTLLDTGAIVWSTRPGPSWAQQTIHEGRVAVAGPETVDRLDKLVEARQIEMAREVRDLLIDKVSNWGSYYGQTTISKNMVCIFIDEAITDVERRFKGGPETARRVR
jgi:hypothetical protein